MDHLTALQRSLVNRLWPALIAAALLPAGAVIGGEIIGLPDPLTYAVAGIAAVLLTYAIAANVVRAALLPVKTLRQAILHVSKETSSEPAPELDKIHLGREMLSTLTIQIYEMASRAAHNQEVEATPAAAVIGGEHMLNATPLPVITVDSSSNIRFINDAALVYLGLTITDRPKLVGKNINETISLNFPSEATYEKWLAECQNNVVKAGNTWNRVRLVDINGATTKQFDLTTSFSKGAGDVESVLVFFDRTESYGADDQQISFVAMAVHELRTPLTIMRGYIEVFEDELGPTLPHDLKDFMFKMKASAQQLTAFVSNILNVARVEENQLILTLHKEDLKSLLEAAVADLELRASVHGKHVSLEVAPNIPLVAADRISVHEVINNLVDNAIKYGGQSDQIKISCVVGRDGMIETSVQDFGVGIPASIIPKLFDKFYRSHRSNTQASGTGLGLYLCKAIVNAHGGNIWVQSKEGEGSVFTFSLEAYDEQRHGAEAHGQDGIMRGAHGWIKNHSLYRQ